MARFEIAFSLIHQFIIPWTKSCFFVVVVVFVLFLFFHWKNPSLLFTSKALDLEEENLDCGNLKLDIKSPEVSLSG